MPKAPYERPRDEMSRAVLQYDTLLPDYSSNGAFHVLTPPLQI